MKASRQPRAGGNAPTLKAVTESMEQCTLIAWWGVYSKTKGIDARLLIAIPNGSVLAGDSKHRAIQAGRLKREGLRSGVPDLMLALPRTLPNGVMLFPGLFIEMKRKVGGKTSPEQLEMATLLRKQGYNVVIAHGFDEAQKAIKGYVERP